MKKSDTLESRKVFICTVYVKVACTRVIEKSDVFALGNVKPSPSTISKAPQYTSHDWNVNEWLQWMQSSLPPCKGDMLHYYGVLWSLGVPPSQLYNLPGIYRHSRRQCLTSNGTLHLTWRNSTHAVLQKRSNRAERLLTQQILSWIRSLPASTEKSQNWQSDKVKLPENHHDFLIAVPKATARRKGSYRQQDNSCGVCMKDHLIRFPQNANVVTQRFWSAYSIKPSPKHVPEDISKLTRKEDEEKTLKEKKIHSDVTDSYLFCR